MSEMMGCDLTFVVPLSWRGPDVPARYPRIEGDTMPTLGFELPPPTGWEGDVWDDVQIDEEHGRIWVSWSGELNYGWSGAEDTPLGWLQEHGIPYVATTDPKYEYDGERESFDGTDVFHVDSSNAGAVITQPQWDALKAGNKSAWVIAAVDRYFARGNLDLEKVDLSHLPADPPTSEEEDDDDAD